MTHCSRNIIPNSGVMNLYHLFKPTPMIPHSVATAVGQNILEKPSPNWNAITATSLDCPIRSATGAKIGMVTTAYPEPDGLKKLTRF